MDHRKGESHLSYIYNLYSSEEGHFGISHACHIKCDLPPHKFRSILMEYRRDNELRTDIEAFIKYMQGTFSSFRLFDYDDTIQFDADQENSTILANLLDEVNRTA